MSRYEVRISNPSRKIHHRRKHFARVIYGVWDTKNNNWVINAKDIGHTTAKRIMTMMNNRI